MQERAWAQLRPRPACTRDGIHSYLLTILPEFQSHTCVLVHDHDRKQVTGDITRLQITPPTMQLHNPVGLVDWPVGTATYVQAA